MPSLKTLCAELFGKDDLYAVLGAEKTASAAELKKSYYRLSLRLHPDRVEEKDKDDSTAKFQLLARVYAILADAEKRRIYDETGEDPDDDDGAFSGADVNKDWCAHWRRMFPAVTEEMIKNFHATYAGSDEEREDLKAFYQRFEGNMEKVLEWMIHRTEEDADRLQSLVDQMISAGELKSTSAFSKTKLTERKKTRRRKRAAEEAAEAEDMLQRIKKKHRMSEDASLEALLRKRQEDREELNGSFLEALEAKYCGGGEGSGTSSGTASGDENDTPADKKKRSNGKNTSKAKSKQQQQPRRRGAKKSGSRR